MLRKYQSRERNLHLRITLTQQNAKILVHIPKSPKINKKSLIYRSFLKMRKNNNLKIKTNLKILYTNPS